jgi:hypothetical protein
MRLSTGTTDLPMKVAAKNGHEVVVKLLVEKGVEPESKDYQHRTPLW